MNRFTEWRIDRVLSKREKPKKNLERWWYRVPVIIVCLLMVFIVLTYHKVVSAATASEFSQLLDTALAMLRAGFDFLLEVLDVIW